MVQDKEIVAKLEEYLKNANVEEVSLGTVRKHLEEVFGISLQDKKDFLKQEINRILTEDEEKADSKDKDASGSEDGEKSSDDNQSEDEGSDRPKSATRRKKTTKSVAKPEKKIQKTKAKSTGEKKSGFQKPMKLHPDLANFLGADTMARTQVVKQICAYVKEKNLQDPKDKRNIILDEAMQKVFKGVKRVTYFSMQKHISPLILGAAEE
eukprot:TRINITY_DN2069_c0_g1::TRINITY_DN2069_c0_g1_i1::g.21892::m.21892 TRINITY_DN2069_c0_g1::TRINITY_DN2069_c0_g1_i1::g.21892  ORF type:complete len:230 (+),score=66.22,sp/O74503/UAF30_SCHPO/42.31/9e-15,SWIB/PF02201.13/39,SWIB/PF02201.13/2.9e-26,DEK_C/PF08766.6/3.5e-13,DEK_C/PF08766.6/1.2e+03,Nop14/PF04147.7/0.0019,DUF3571/PF12095.3/0.45,DUF3571/PF12095.3/1.6e+03,CDC45/PF02724.9/0.22,Glypican/PF01153.14/0.26,DUF2201_N/PF13203.1/0.75,Vfa1/PF08432.5/2.7e+03,Vfa1/PF08432.5/0.18 TRINITY_DN2069_c0_g1_i1:65-